MDRRKSLKSIVLGSVAGGLAIHGCRPEPTVPEVGAQEVPMLKWRTPKENEQLAELHAEQFFNPHEAETLTVLCDLILPGSEEYKSASDADVVSFIEFMAKDMPTMQVDLRGGLMWLDHRSNLDHGVEFKGATEAQRKAILDTVAYYDPEVPGNERPFEVNFFSMVRNLTMTGFYTSKIGIEELGYKGNMPNVWDGVPDDVLEQHGVSYDPEWLAKCVDQSKRNIVAEWDENGNLIT
ncbi:Gluconate 2-dehydrogenase subunit 3 [Flagellimonas taeanensis]|uniref:Gluconate 2-dehydrogenase subunit 3 n=2 Tax=Flagellimonas taeanensis TaxID=1005926 RepID=A0A1M6UGD1_9FLAO|nr:gluconate 2-dehydrogenase subunit 3 family protein [Allomuricauda taeanensis]SFC37151.1 Gluconate 2-dehydrogenase subunit 3 [Allomuricauda taeanensis]SFC56450.1 Gluconate 2-dehydrogenase subunit 3 [Allomuricauda taeanensis]SHK68282.1 Gluconate 2-dehydrogenase subunit 3 [Allomuricauda taeanensis]SHL49279.1 Gluconate 2-dehydrogenase subunit 3 [Allomuricauda taeanensis]